MLVLSRKQDEDIVIGDNIRVRILAVKGNTIRIGIEAPRDVKIIRGELEMIAAEVQLHDSDSFDSAASDVGSDSEAEVTIVFSNDDPPTSNKPTDSRPSRLDVIPFSKSRIAHSSQQSKNVGSNGSASLRGREPLSPSLQHNRLKEIIKKLTPEN